MNVKLKSEQTANVECFQLDTNVLKTGGHEEYKTCVDIPVHSETKVFIVTNELGDDRIGMETPPVSSSETKVFIVTSENGDNENGIETPPCSSAEETKELIDSVAMVKNVTECLTDSSKEYADTKDVELRNKLIIDYADHNIYILNTHDATDSGYHGDFENGVDRKQNMDLSVSCLLEKETVNDFLKNEQCDRNDPDLKCELSVPDELLTDNKESERWVHLNQFVTKDKVSDFSNSEDKSNLPPSESRKDSLRKTGKRKYGRVSKRKLKRETSKSIKDKILKKSSVTEEEKRKTWLSCNSQTNIKGKRKQPPRDDISEHEDLNSKARVCEDNKKFQCHVCGKFLKSTSAVIVHQRIHTGEKPFPCTICKKSFSVKVSLNRHLRTHTGEKPYVCSFCEDSFGQAASLKRHLGRHTGNYPFKCHLCEKRYIQHSDLVGHLRSHTGMKREKMWMCEVCGSGFVSTRNLVRHVKWVHIANKPFVCDICRKGFVELGKLTAHQRYHTGERPFKCSICERGFVDKGYLREHMKIHEDREKKTFKCKMCEKGFSTSKNLYRHVRTIHTKEEVYSCNICWKNFGQAGNLKIHRLRHHKDVADSAGFLKPGSNLEDDDDIYETYICEQNKVYAETSQNGNDSCVEDSSRNESSADFINMSSKVILEKYGCSKLKSSSGGNIVSDNESQKCSNSESESSKQELTELMDNQCDEECVLSTVDEND